MIQFLRNHQDSPITPILMGLVSCAMLFWGVDKVFQKLPQSHLASTFTTTLSDEAMRVYNQLLYNNHGNGQEAPNNEQLLQYKQIAILQAQHNIKKRSIADIEQLYLHPYVIKDVATQTGILENNDAEKNQQLRGRVELLHQHARRLMLDEALNATAIEDQTTQQATKHLFDVRKTFQWVTIPSIDKNYYQKYQPSKQEIEAAYQAKPFQEDESFQIDYITIPSTKTQHTVDSVLEQLLLQPNDLSALAKHYDVKINHSKNFTQSKGNKQDITRYESLRQHVFNSTLATQKLHDPLILPNGSIIVFKKTQHNIGAKKPLSIVKNDIIRDLKQQQATQHQTSRIKKLHQDLITQKTTLASIAKKQQLKLNKSSWLSPESPQDQAPNTIHSLGFNHIPNLHKGDKYAEHTLSEDGKNWYIFIVNDVKFTTESNNKNSTTGHSMLTQLEINHLLA